MTLHVTTFGGLDIAGADRRRYALRGMRQRALLAYLALSPKSSFSRAHLAELLWPEAAEDEARHNLRQCLTLTRRALGTDAGVLLTEGDRVALDRSCVETDVELLNRYAASTDLDGWRRAGALCSGEVLAGLELGGTPFDEWLVHQRRANTEKAISVLVKLAEAQGVAGDRAGAVSTMRRVIFLDPLDETERRRLMRLLMRDGRSDAAIREYRELSALLNEHLAVEPSPDTTQLYREALEGRELPAPDETEMLRTYATALEQLPDSVIVTDLLTRIVGFSPVAERSFGLRKEDVLGKTPAVLHAADRESTVPLQLTRLALTHGKWTETVELTTSNGAPKPVRRSVVTLRSPSGRPIGAFGITSGTVS